MLKLWPYCVFELAYFFPTCHHPNQYGLKWSCALKVKTRDGYTSWTSAESATSCWLFSEELAHSEIIMSLTLYVPVAHVFTVLGESILKIIGSLQFNKRFTTGTAFFGVGETHSVHLPNNVTVWEREKKQSRFYFIWSRIHDAHYRLKWIFFSWMCWYLPEKKLATSSWVQDQGSPLIRTT